MQLTNISYHIKYEQIVFGVASSQPVEKQKCQSDRLKIYRNVPEYNGTVGIRRRQWNLVGRYRPTVLSPLAIPTQLGKSEFAVCQAFEYDII